jgi:uncharacterized phiE125 gp8 family phage protein
VILRLTTPPVSEPVTLAEAKAHLRLETTADDATVVADILAARQHVEQVCWRGLVTQTWEAVLDAFPGDVIELPQGHLVSIASVKYIDTAGAEQTLATTEYEADTSSVPGNLRLAYDKSWPDTRTQWNAVVVRYVVGWPVADVPQPIKSAILLLVSQLYEHRTPEVLGAIVSKVNFAVNALLAPYRLVRFT